LDWGHCDGGTIDYSLEIRMVEERAGVKSNNYLVIRRGGY
jgi:hypothetical protein